MLESHPIPGRKSYVSAYGVGGEPLHRAGETTVEAAVRLCAHLAGGVLPIQGRGAMLPKG
jgi:hypothetical protein